MPTQDASGSAAPEKIHFASGKNRGDSFSFMMAEMLGKLLGSDATETKAQKIQNKRNFLKDAIETAMAQIRNFGGLEEWLSNIEHNDQGYSPEMQAWIKNEASQMKNFKDKNAQQSISAADKNIKADRNALSHEESELKAQQNGLGSSALKTFSSYNNDISSIGNG